VRELHGMVATAVHHQLRDECVPTIAHHDFDALSAGFRVGCDAGGRG
jgi:hypothetical protein